jgi:hypothetical protein
MVDPLSLGAIGGVALTEGVKFLYAQAGEVLRRWRERPRTDSPASDAALRPPGELLDGEVEPTEPDLDRVGAVERELRDIRRSLAVYADESDPEPVDPTDGPLLEQVDVLRRLLEVVYGQRITLKGESREPSGPLVEGEIDVDQVAGDAAAVRARVIESGQVKGSAKAKRVERGGRLSGVDTDRIG